MAKDFSIPKEYEIWNLTDEQRQELEDCCKAFAAHRTMAGMLPMTKEKTKDTEQLIQESIDEVMEELKMDVNADVKQLFKSGAKYTILYSLVASITLGIGAGLFVMIVKFFWSLV